MAMMRLMANFVVTYNMNNLTNLTMTDTSTYLWEHIADGYNYDVYGMIKC